MPRGYRILLVLLLAVTAGCAGAKEERTPSPPPTVAVEEDTPVPTVDTHSAFAQNERLGRGVNLGNALEGPSEGAWGVYLQEEYFGRIKEGGFDSVRIPIRWSAHALTEPPYTIKDKFLARVDWAVDQALSRDLAVVINTHHYYELFADPQAQRERFLALWAQIAAHYQDYPDGLMFEPLNEPNDQLTAGAWNPLLQEVIATIRETNPTRTIVVGPANWNSIDSLSSLQLPEDDRNIIVTFHYYNPFQFTHQGAEWAQGSNAWLGTTWPGSAGGEADVTRDLDRAVSWAEAHERPLFMGEFGAYSKADMDSRARWTTFVARQAEARGMSWAYWEFCSGFGVYDSALKRWNEPLYDALIPKE